MPINLNGKTVIAAAFTVALTMITFGQASPSIRVQIASMICATVLLVASFAYEILKELAKHRELGATAREIAAAAERTTRG